MNVLKIIGKFFAGLLALFGITIFIMSYFGIYATNNFNILENDINAEMNELLQDNGINCINNPENENCRMLGQNPIVETIRKEVEDFKYYGNAMRIIGFIFIIAGFLLFVLCSSWIDGARQTSLILLIGSLFSYFYYKYMVMGALSSFLQPEILGVINNWAQASISQTTRFIAILIAIFLILTIALYLLKRKRMKEEGKTNG